MSCDEKLRAMVDAFLTNTEKILEKDVIQSFAILRSSQVALFHKRDGTCRFCVGYRRLKRQQKKKDVYRLPWTCNTLNWLRGTKYFSAIDFCSRNLQVSIDEKDGEKTAFVNPEELFELTVMQFGLCNAPATFEHMIDVLLGGLKSSICLCYLDDIIIFCLPFPNI